jgi:hypothetical protein
MRYLKASGKLAAVAGAFALLGAAPASASSFTAGESGQSLSSTTLTNFVFKITGSELKCSSVKIEGKTEGSLEGGKYHNATQRIHPSGEGCEAFGFSSGVSVTITGCDIVVGSSTTSGMASAELVDHSGQTCEGITITATPAFTTCTVVIQKQTVSNALSYTNNSSKVKAKVTATGIKADVTTSSGLCPLTTGLHEGASGASLTGEVEVSASGGVEYTP